MIAFHVLGTLELRTPDGEHLGSALSGSKRLALLSYLTLATPRGPHRRDTLLGLFWPDLDQKHARNSLSNMLYQIRQSLGRQIIEAPGADEVGLRSSELWCDANAFEDALDRGNLSEALELYRGDLLTGFFAPNVSAEFDHWLDRERSRLRLKATGAARTLTDRAERAGNAIEAVRWTRRAASLDPYDETAARRLVALLAETGDRSGALRAYESFAERLAAEFAADPSPATRALVAKLRSQPKDDVNTSLGHIPPRQAPRGTSKPRCSKAQLAARINADIDPETPDRRQAALEGSGPRAHGSTKDSQPSGGVPQLRSRTAVLSMVVLLAATLIAAMGLRSAEQEQVPRFPTIAVGEIRSYAPGDSSQLGAVAALLATSLARETNLRVLSSGRLYEVATAGSGPAALQSAARRAGGDQIVEGTLSSASGGLLRLDLRRIDLHTGVVRQAYRIHGADPFVIVDRATALLLDSFDLSAPPTGIAAVTTPSLLAFRFYEEGLRAYYEGNTRTAYRLLSTALDEDSTFAMAAYYRALSREKMDHASFREDLGRAVRHANRASDRERLLIQTVWAREMDEPRQLALAETLSVSYPTEPDGHLFLGQARLSSGDFLGALPHLRRVVTIDSMSLQGRSPRCRACDAYREIVNAYLLADSLAAAERTARRWVELRNTADAWFMLARTLEYQGRTEDARLARRRSMALGSNDPRNTLYPAMLALREGDFETADRLLAELDDAADPLVQQNVLWFRVLSLRYQNRFAEALVEAREYRRQLEKAASAGHPPVWAPLLEAQVLHESDRADEAAELWRRIAFQPYEPDSPARTARHRAWTLTHAAAAHAAAGDTAALAPLADSIEAFGAQSAYGRDPLLHHYVRGLMWKARGDAAAAAESFRRAMFSPTSGYGRINLELGRALLALGRPEEAIPVLSGVLRGPLDYGNLYVNRAEIHQLLNRAYLATGQPDSAAIHGQWGERSFAKLTSANFP